MKPDIARQRAEDCRMVAGHLLAIAIAAVIAGTCVWWSLGPGFLLLACIIVAVVCGIGALHETAEAGRLERQARDWHPNTSETWGHE